MLEYMNKCSTIKIYFDVVSRHFVISDNRTTIDLIYGCSRRMGGDMARLSLLELCVLLFLDSYRILFIAVACEALFQVFRPDILINIGIDSPRVRKSRI